MTARPVRRATAMRKRIVERRDNTAAPAGALPIESIAQVEVTSEHPEFPIEAALSEGGRHGWRAGAPGEQRVAVIFDQPERVRKMTLKFIETDRPRTHEFVLTWSSDADGAAHVIVRQQWTFSPGGSTTESETYEMDLHGVRKVELTIKPDLRDNAAIATLTEWRIFGGA